MAAHRITLIAVAAAALIVSLLPVAPAVSADRVGIGIEQEEASLADEVNIPVQLNFQQTSVEMKDRRKLFGMIQEETGQTVKIFLPTGERVVVNANDIKKRTDAKNSGMPASFAYTLSPQDVADVAAWIMSLK